MSLILDPSPTLNHFHSSQTSRPARMPFNLFRRKSGRQDSDLLSASPSRQASTSKSSGLSRMSTFRSSHHFGNTSQPTRRPAPRSTIPPTGGDEPPPAYTPGPSAKSMPPAPTATTEIADSKYAFLSQFDTVFLIDDSGSMAGRSWRETASTLAALVPICTAHDADGIDIYFLNKPDSDQYRNITNPDAVTHIFSTTAPRGITLTGTRLQAILNPYLDKVERAAKVGQIHTIKPLNIIVITDGVPSDDPESVIVLAAKRLDRCDAPLRQVGIQFFQVGQETEAAAALQELDDELEKRTGARDIVDTVPFNSGKYGVTPGSPLSEKKILKAVLGAVTPRLDRLSNNP